MDRLPLLVALCGAVSLASAQPASAPRSGEPTIGGLVTRGPSLDAFTDLKVSAAPHPAFAKRDAQIAGGLKTKLRTYHTDSKSPPADAGERRPHVTGVQSEYGISPVVSWKSSHKVLQVEFLVGGTQSYSYITVQRTVSPVGALHFEETRFLPNFHAMLNGLNWPLVVRLIYEDGQVWVAGYRLKPDYLRR